MADVPMSLEPETNPVMVPGEVPEILSRQSSFRSATSGTSVQTEKTESTVKSASSATGSTGNGSAASGGAGGEMSSRLKTTCVSCVHSKIKCTGGDLTHPCQRCSTRGFQCVFELEKKRGRRSVARSSKGGADRRQRKNKRSCGAAVCWGEVVMTGTAQSQLGWLENTKTTMDFYHKRLFRMFFTVYKHHASPQSCCKEWFSFQLNKICMLLMKAGHRGAMARLAEWMKKHKVRVLPLDESQYTKLPPTAWDNERGMEVTPLMRGPLMPQVCVRDPMTPASGAPQSEKFTPPEQRMVDAMRTGPFLYMNSTYEGVVIETNDQFSALLGYTGTELTAMLSRLYGGFLPWAGDLLALLLVHDHDLLAMLRILAIKFSQLGRPRAMPALRKVASIESALMFSKTGDEVECQIKCMLVEHLFKDRARVEIYFGFEAHGPAIPSTFKAHPMANTIVTPSTHSTSSSSSSPFTTHDAASSANAVAYAKHAKPDPDIGSSSDPFRPSMPAIMRMPFDAAPGPVISEAGLYDAKMMASEDSLPNGNADSGGGDRRGDGGLEEPLGDISISGNVSLFDGMLDDEVWFDTLLNWVDAPDGESNGTH